MSETNNEPEMLKRIKQLIDSLLGVQTRLDSVSQNLSSDLVKAQQESRDAIDALRSMAEEMQNGDKKDE